MLLSKRSKSDETDAISDQAVVKRYNFLRSLVAWSFLAGMFGLIILCIARYVIPPFWLSRGLMLSFIPCGVFGTIFYYDLWHLTGTARAYQRYVARLIQSNTASDAKHMIDALETDLNPDQRVSILETLTRILPLVEEYDDLPKAQQAHLLRYVEHVYQMGSTSQTSDVAVPAIRALALVGTHRSMMTMRRMTSKNSSTPLQAKIYSAIAEAFPIMQKRIARQNTQATLLRASAPTQSTGELLRAANSTRSNPESDAQLLRASLGREDKGTK